MRRRTILTVATATFVWAAAATCGMAASTIGEAITGAADYLAATQETDGSWSGSEGWTGPIVSGMVNAYQITSDTDYSAAASAGGSYILNTLVPTYGYMPGDAAYGLTRLSEISVDPGNNAWRDNVSNFYTYIFIGCPKSCFFK